MILRGLELLDLDLDLDLGRADRKTRDITISNDRIVSIEESARAGAGGEDEIEFAGALAFPGLINSHDHLEFNLYPPLGHRHYRDYVEWGFDIQARDRATIDAIQAVPEEVRFAWGALKNTLLGVTTVAHHGAEADELPGLEIGVVERGTSLHSVQLGRRWRRRLNSPRNRAPYVIHIGEGVSEGAAGEIDRLLRWNLLGRSLIGVHAIAMNEKQAERFSALVWCPASNEFLFGVTAPIARLKHRTHILFGTDSTLTADWNLWTHLRRARAIGALSDPELFAALTTTAARVWRLGGKGRIAPGWTADLVVARKKAESTWDAFFAIEPEDILLVMRGGRVLLQDPAVESRTRCMPHRLRVRGCEKRISADAGALFEALRGRGIRPNLPIEAHGAGHVRSSAQPG